MSNSNFNWPNRPDWVDSARTESDSRNNDLVIVDVQYHDVTFADLLSLSETFGTTLINIDREVREGGYCGYCETCRFTYTITTITIMNPTRMP